MKNPTCPRSTRRLRPRSWKRRLEQHFLSCSVLAAGLGTHGAQAATHYSGMLNLPVPQDNNVGVSVDFDTGAFVIGPMTLSGYDLNVFEQAGTQLLQVRSPNGAGGVLGFTATPYTYGSKLVAGQSVGPGGNFLGGINILGVVDSTGNHGDFAGGVTGGFLGLRFVSSAPGSPTLYGWARFDVTTNLQAILVDYAFEDSGGGILTGAGVVVPEPGSLALGCLAAGATGLAVWRQRRRERESV